MKQPLDRSSPKKVIGDAVESRVASHLAKQGFQIQYRNFRCRLGEIDLIGIHENQLIFVEVRSKSRQDYGTAAESVNFRKQKKLIRTAQFFLACHPHFANAACRFDVVAVTLEKSDPEIEWIKNAFY